MPILSWEQVAAAALLGGWSGEAAVIAVSITQPESSRDDTVIQAGQPYATTGWGLWQITPGDSVPQFGINQKLLNPVNNALAGHFKYAQAGGFSPWTTYENGLNVPYLGSAGAAVRAVQGMSRTALEHVLGSSGPAPGGAPGPALTAPDWSTYVKSSSASMGEGASRLKDYGTAISGLAPKFTPPRVTMPNPATLLWRPGERLPT